MSLELGEELEGVVRMVQFARRGGMVLGGLGQGDVVEVGGNLTGCVDGPCGFSGHYYLW